MMMMMMMMMMMRTAGYHLGVSRGAHVSRDPLSASGPLGCWSAAATAATLALPTGVTPYQQLITSQGQILQVVRAPNGAQYIIQQPQQQILLQQQMQPGGVQAPVIQQVRPITQIHRSKNKWKFHLKDGIMNLNGRDYVFSKAIGDAEW
ncbi:hypothetical protein CRUP_016743 [Coryphaenoides rupestris]|nr:hypothetical protein CRUP_016743 [Coryphaenoides rupestris]